MKNLNFDENIKLIYRDIISIMLIKRAIIDLDDGSTIDALIYYHYYILIMKEL